VPVNGELSLMLTEKLATTAPPGAVSGTRGVLGFTVMTGCDGPGGRGEVEECRIAGPTFGGLELGAAGADGAPSLPISGREARSGGAISISPLAPRRSAGTDPPPDGNSWAMLTATTAAHSNIDATPASILCLGFFAMAAVIRASRRQAAACAA
jgi:hypothetical protein